MISYILFFLQVALEVYTWMFFAYIILSWFPISHTTPFLGFIMRFLVALCEPVYSLVLRILPPLRIGIMDFSPLYIFLLLELLQIILNRIAIWILSM